MRTEFTLRNINVTASDFQNKSFNGIFFTVALKCKPVKDCSNQKSKTNIKETELHLGFLRFLIFTKHLFHLITPKYNIKS